MESYIHLILTLRELPHGRHQKSVKISDFIFKCFFLFLFLYLLVVFMANAKVRNVEEGLQGHIAKFIIFVFVNMRLIFVFLPHVNVKGWTLWIWARGNLANEFLYGGTCPIEIDGKTCSTICRKFYCKKRPFQRWWTLVLHFAKNGNIVKELRLK